MEIELSENQHMIVERIARMADKKDCREYMLCVGWPRFSGATTALCMAAIRLIEKGKNRGGNFSKQPLGVSLSTTLS